MDTNQMFNAGAPELGDSITVSCMLSGNPTAVTFGGGGDGGTAAMAAAMPALLQKVQTNTATRAERDDFKRLAQALAQAGVARQSAAASRRSELDSGTRQLTRELRARQVQEAMGVVTQAEEVDLAFVIDCTGSMDAHIEAVRARVHDIVAQVRRSNPALRVRLAAVGYRDIGDTKRLETLDFALANGDSGNSSPGTSAFARFVGGLEAVGGGDTCEDLGGGLRAAARLTWRSQTRVLFLIADAPCHGRGFHDGLLDDYPGGTPDGVDVLAELGTLTGRLRVKVHLGRIHRHTDVMMRRFAAHVEAQQKQQQQAAPAGCGGVGGVGIGGGGGGSFASTDLADAGMLTAAVTDSVRSAILQTVTAGMSSHARRVGAVTFMPVLGALLEESEERPSSSSSSASSSSGGGSSSSGGSDGGAGAAARKKKMPRLKVFELDASPPRFGAMPWRAAQVLTHVTPDTVDELLLKPMDLRRAIATTDGAATTLIKIAPRPFAQGSCRLAYRGQVQAGGTTREMVFKEFKHEGRGVHDRVQYRGQIEVSTVAAFLAGMYNRSRARLPGDLPIEFLSAHIAEVGGGSGPGSNCSGPKRTYCMEATLPAAEGGTADFTKWSNNTGYWAHDRSTPECKTLARFSRYTYAVTHGQIMVVDLQGVLAAAGGGKKRRFVLTDPVVLCKDLSRFGHTNLGSDDCFKRCLDSAALACEAGADLPRAAPSAPPRAPPAPTAVRGVEAPNPRRLSVACGKHSWTKDSESKTCQLCTKRFSLLTRRRHHCRKCGILVCDDCSQHRIRLAPQSSAAHGTSDIPARVCDSCW
jgi:hypothetical protein